jgi:hypothetical protein
MHIERSAKTDEEEIQSLISENDELRGELNLLRVKHIKVVQATGTGLEPIAGGVMAKRLDDLHNEVCSTGYLFIAFLIQLKLPRLLHDLENSFLKSPRGKYVLYRNWKPYHTKIAYFKCFFPNIVEIL